MRIGCKRKGRGVGPPHRLARIHADRPSFLKILERPDIIRQIMPIRNRADDGGLPADEAIGTEFLQLVRFGLRDAEDPLILASIRVADALYDVYINEVRKEGLIP